MTNAKSQACWGQRPRGAATPDTDPENTHRLLRSAGPLPCCLPIKPSGSVSPASRETKDSSCHYYHHCTSARARTHTRNELFSKTNQNNQNHFSCTWKYFSELWLKAQFLAFPKGVEAPSNTSILPSSWPLGTFSPFR